MYNYSFVLFKKIFLQDFSIQIFLINSNTQITQLYSLSKEYIINNKLLKV